MNTFPLIVQKYREHTDSILRKGDFPLRETFNGFWGISVCEEVFELFKKLRLRYYNNFLDLGSGDGRVAAIASLFTNATGIESDKELYEKGLKIKNKLKLDCDFINKNFYEGDYYKLRIGDYRALINIDFENKILKIEVIDKRGRIYKS